MTVHRVPKFQATARIIMIAGAAIGGVLALTAWMIWDAHRVTETHAIQSSENVVSALTHDIERNIEIYDLSLRAVIDGLNAPGIWDVSDNIRNQILFDGSANAADLGAIFVLDEKGDILLDSRVDPPRHVNLSDRDYFQVHRDRKDVGLYVSAPYQGRLTDGAWSIAFSRRIDHPDGSFAGVVIGSLRLAYFQRLFDGVDLGPHGSVTLIRSDASVVMRVPYDVSLIGRKLSLARIFGQSPPLRAGHFETISPIDNIKHLVVYQKIGDLPLILVVAPATATIFAEWQQKAIFTGVSMAGLLALTALLAVALRGQLLRAERADARLIEAIDSISEGFVIYDEDDRLVTCNDAYRALYPENAYMMVPGVRFEDIQRAGLAAGQTPDAVGREEEWLDERMRMHRQSGSTYEHRLKNGHWVLASERRMPSGGMAGLRVDITPLKSVQASLRESQALLNLAQRVSKTGSVLRDFRNQRAEWSDETYRIFGVTREEFQPGNKMFMSLVHPEDRDKVHASIAASEQGLKTPPLQYRIIRRDGEIRWLYRESEIIFDPDGKPGARLSTYKDVTDQRATELRQAELENQLRHSQKLEALGTLAGGVAHDLNNTLVPILALSKIAAKRLPVGSAERRELETIAQAGAQARDLVKQILAFSRKEKAFKQSVDLAALVRDTLKMLRASVPTTIQIVEHIAEVPRIHADAVQFNQVIINLVTNAAQAIGESFGTITVTVAPSSGTETVSGGGNATPGVCLAIADTGSGIDEIHLERVFEPFFTTKEVGQGTGLGLAVVHGIVVSHGGRIECRTKRDEGSVFTIFLPAMTGSESAPAMQPAA
jgi:PAS domain S-box-containing protein